LAKKIVFILELKKRELELLKDDFFSGLLLHSFSIVVKKPSGLEAIDIQIQKTHEHPGYHQKQQNHLEVKKIK